MATDLWGIKEIIRQTEFSQEIDNDSLEKKSGIGKEAAGRWWFYDKCWSN